MRIVLDLQAVQTESRHRGVGRYSLSLARAMIMEGKDHEFVIALNHAFPETVDTVKSDFADLVPPERIVVFAASEHTSESNPNDAWRRRASELVREYALDQLKPDLIYASHLFEGLQGDAVTSVGSFSRVPTAVTLYDLIPYHYAQYYLADPIVNSWYMRKVNYLRKAEVLLAISEYTKRDAVDVLRLASDRVVNISGDADPQFRKLELTRDAVASLMTRFGLRNGFVMYTGGIDYRKNLERLIEAYSLLPESLRAEHQLVICCKAEEAERRRLVSLASRLGVPEGDLIFTGYVSDEDLVALYNTCMLFVFPSLSEGFGLPVLEAMRCGAPVIGSSSSSIPEVIGLDSALFNPTSSRAISGKLHEALSDDQFRRMLVEHARTQSHKFSWKASATRAMEAINLAIEMRQHAQKQATVFSQRSKPRLAYHSPLPPQRSGIADYAAELLPELERYYRIDLITDLPQVDAKLAAFSTRSVAEFVAHGREYDRVIYEFGNSEFHTHMFASLSRHPGTVVLHDFFLGNILNHMENTLLEPAAFRRALYRSHGYQGLMYWQEKGHEQAAWNYPSCLEVLRGAQGVIVHSPHNLSFAEKYFPGEVGLKMRVIPQPCRLPLKIDREGSRRALGVPQDAFLVCSFGFLVETKLDDRLLDAWQESHLSRDPGCYLVFVGGGQGTPYERSLRDRTNALAAGTHVHIAGYVDANTYGRYLQAADVAVQLRANYRGGTARTALDCMSYGLPTIVNSHGSFTELPSNTVVKLPDKFSNSELAEAMDALHVNGNGRQALKLASETYIRNNLDPAEIARQYAQAVESFAATHCLATRRRLISSIGIIGTAKMPSDAQIAEVAQGVAEAESRDQKHLFVDVSVLVHTDARTGVQRVTRKILQWLLQDPPSAYRIEPVYRSCGVYRYARCFTGQMLGVGEFGLDDAPVDVSPGDIFLGLDLDLGLSSDDLAAHWLRHNTRRGLRTFFVVYDMLPLLRGDCFPAEVSELFNAWLELVASVSEGLIAISNAVATELSSHMRQRPAVRVEPLRIGYFHLGADIVSSGTDTSDGHAVLLAGVHNSSSVLMVGTVEPRKGYKQAVDAFELLWARGCDARLVIVGKKGWAVDELADRLRGHPELGKRLLWLEQASDEFLYALYRNASVLLMASEGEGFGLPIIEAAHQGLPVIARDLPIFREIAGDHAFYFAGREALDLADAVQKWLELHSKGEHPRSNGMHCLTWEQSATQLRRVILGSNWLMSWDAERANLVVGSK